MAQKPVIGATELRAQTIGTGQTSSHLTLPAQDTERFRQHDKTLGQVSGISKLTT